MAYAKVDTMFNIYVEEIYTSNYINMSVIYMFRCNYLFDLIYNAIVNNVIKLCCITIYIIVYIEMIHCY